MGLIKTIKESFARAKAVGMQAKAELEEAARYRAMTRAEAEQLSDEELWNCVSFWLCRLEDGKALAEESLARRAVYTVDTFDREVQNGGLCQYFVNSSRETAPELEEALTQVGAESYRKLFHDFVTENDIDVTQLDSFIIHSTEDFEAQNERYPFDAFDEAYYDLYQREPLDAHCTAYIRRHLGDFFDR